MEDLKKQIKSAAKSLFNADIEPEFTRPDEQFGDYATNVALQLAKKMANPPAGGPREIADALTKEIKGPEIEKAEAAGQGFINITLTDEALIKLAHTKPGQPLKGKVVVAEYSDPNPFKILHAGHVYTTIIGEAIAQLLEQAGAKVHRVNYGGDVGLHVAKTMWSILKELGGENPDRLSKVEKKDRSAWLSSHYVAGHAAYEDDEKAKQEITQLNKQVYQIHDQHDHKSPLAQIYWTCRKWSYDAFDEFYARLGAKLEKYYPESEVAGLGLDTVKKQTGKVFEKSKGAVIFNGEKYGLHTRVFINSEGLPTYETKEVGLIIQKGKDYHFDKSVVITDNEQEQYMAVVLRAIEQFLPKLVAATTHITHGKLRLAGGVKMSSRLGNIIPAHEVIDITAAANKETYKKEDESVVLAAIKYAFSKQRIGVDIIYDPKESVSLEGNSGPYLQYAHARACSILKKKSPKSEKPDEFEKDERSLLRKISEFPEVVDKSVGELMPHHICTYLYELAQNFNRFYEKNRVIGDKREGVRLQLVQLYAETLKKGLNLLNIEAPEKM